jgi:hypothetical protein
VHDPLPAPRAVAQLERHGTRKTGNPGLRLFKKYVVAPLGNPFRGPAINA